MTTERFQGWLHYDPTQIPPKYDPTQIPPQPQPPIDSEIVGMTAEEMLAVQLGEIEKQAEEMLTAHDQESDSHQSKPLDHQVGGEHYKNYAIQPVDYILSNEIPFCEANIIKYVTRWKDKGGVVDLRKAEHYLQILISRSGGELPDEISRTQQKQVATYI